MACDSDARITVWEYNGNKVKPVQSVKTDKAGLRCVSIEPDKGKFILCGGVSTQLHLYEINMKTKKHEVAAGI